MTVRVVYTQDGEEKSVDFDYEQQASIFIDGLNSREPDDRNYTRFKCVEYPDKSREMTDDDWDELRRGVRSGDIPNPLGGT